MVPPPWGRSEELEAEVGSPLDYFIAEGWITRVLGIVKSGKEATVYRCEAAPSTGVELLAAKVYRPREDRSFRDDAVYRAGRWVGDRRMERALRNKSRAGREYQFSSWLDQEWEVLNQLYALGADVPRPFARSGDAILMEYLGDEDEPAPRLHDVRLDPAEARALHGVLMRNVELWLARNVIHGDLSAYNVLYWQGQVRAIDFPQAVDPRSNPHALRLLERDVRNLCDYFARQGLQTNPDGIARSLWSCFLRAEL